jgi:hybrid cluster-associated redox disulfide protein
MTRHTSISAKSKKEVHQKKMDPKASSDVPLVHRWMSVADIADLHPDAGDVLAAYGLHCIGCAFSSADTLEDGAVLHGLSDDDIENILIDLNDLLLQNTLSKPATLTLTERAAQKLRTLVEASSAPPYILRVSIDEEQKFFLEPLSAPEEESFTVSHSAVPDLSICVSKETLTRISGATIDEREGRLKLDLPMRGKCCKKSGEQEASSE